MSARIVGTCSNCGGHVVLPALWLGVTPPVPTCWSCGATAAQPHLPVIPMNPIKPALQTGACSFCGQPAGSGACQRNHP